MLNNIAGFLGGALAPIVGDYESIQTATPSGTGTVTFSTIPSTYKHLQLRYNAGSNNGAGSDQIILRFNSDSSSANYTTHYLQGNGSGTPSAYGYGTGGFAGAYLDKGLTGDSATTFGVGVVDLLDYKNTNKYKTMRSLHGFDSNGSGNITLQSALWLNTAAISSITIVLNSGSTFRTNSHFALYGIKG